MFAPILDSHYLVERVDLFDRVNITLQIANNKLARNLAIDR